MPTRVGFRQAGNVGIDSSRSLPSRWSRFSAEQTTKTHGRKLYRDLILNNVVSCSLAAPCTHRDVVKQIARQSWKYIPIEFLPTILQNSVHSRGRTFFGFPRDYFDKIACNYARMRWWVSELGLNMKVIASTGPSVPEFDELAGRLMAEARSQRLSNGRLPLAEYNKIAVALDEAGFRLQNHLERAFRRKLADWNQKHPNQAIHTFYAALDATIALPVLSVLRRGVQKRLNRAESRWERLNKMSAL
jgi:hypothetical protein